jgi:hypothetical protein
MLIIKKKNYNEETRDLHWSKPNSKSIYDRQSICRFIPNFDEIFILDEIVLEKKKDLLDESWKCIFY